VVIGNGVTSIGYSAFNCTSLMSITFKGTIEQWNAIGYDDWWNVLATKVVCSDGEVEI